MALVRWKDFCIDAVDIQAEGRFWAQALGLEFHAEDGYVWLAGPTDEHRIWVNQVPEPRTVKNRVHIDVHTGSLAELEALGARPLETFPRWTVMADPEGQEFCAFVRDPVPDYRFYELVVDSADPVAIGRWWADVFGVELEVEDFGAGITGAPGVPFEYFVFGTVPEPRTAKNRLHWDVKADPDELVAAGATLLRPKGGDLGWHVLADPEGNEFCVFDD
jgi:hypothetical protein